MVFVTGDTHGDWINRLNVNSFPEQKEMTKDDYVIICGDFGIWDNSKREKYNLSWLDDKPFTTLFVSGNHENYDILDNLEISEWHGGLVNFVRKSVIHLMRGQVFNIEDKTESFMKSVQELGEKLGINYELIIKDNKTESYDRTRNF